jgi:hypothetical protein
MLALLTDVSRYANPGSPVSEYLVRLDSAFVSSPIAGSAAAGLLYRFIACAIV